jgi:glycosyltransferase involved in cell wall biosynthesis
VCDVRQEHPGFQRQILEEESQLLGIPFSLAGTSYESKVLEEFELADHLVVPSSHAKRTFIERGFAPERVIQLPYGVDHSLFPTTIAATRIEPFRILFVGAIIPRKGIHYLLEAFRRIQRKDMELVLVGPLPPEMEPFLRRNAGYFTHLPVVPRVDLGGIYGRSSVFVLPSLADAFPLVALEAMASGLPVIITENTGTRDFVTDGKEGFIVPIRDVEAIQEKLEYLYLHREAASEMGRRANAMVGNLTWQKYRESAISLYENFR